MHSIVVLTTNMVPFVRKRAAPYVNMFNIMLEVDMDELPHALEHYPGCRNLYFQLMERDLDEAEPDEKSRHLSREELVIASGREFQVVGEPTFVDIYLDRRVKITFDDVLKKFFSYR